MMKIPTALLAAAALLGGCVVPKPPSVPQLPSPPTYTFSSVPVAPRCPTPPKPPTTDLPKVPDVDWRTLWTEDFTNDGFPKSLSVERKADAQKEPPKPGGAEKKSAIRGLVFPSGTTHSLRTDLVGGFLSAGFSVADLGLIRGSQFSFDRPAQRDLFGRTVNAEGLVFGLEEPLAEWVRSNAPQDLELHSILRVYELHVAEAVKEVVKFDINQHLAKLEAYNSRVAEYIELLDAYEAGYDAYEDEHAKYLLAMMQWRADTKSEIEALRADYERKVSARVQAFDEAWAKYALSASRSAQRSKIREKPALDPLPFKAPRIPRQDEGKIRKAHLPRLEVLSIEEMRKLLTDIATERVPSVEARLLGQFVHRATGRTTHTVDLTLVVPKEREPSSSASLLSELIQRAR